MIQSLGPPGLHWYSSLGAAAPSELWLPVRSTGLPFISCPAKQMRLKLITESCIVTSMR